MPSLPFDPEQVYSPAEDTSLLLGSALKEARPDDMVLELGCGMAVISRELAKAVRSVLATDINPHALKAARAAGLQAVRADLFRGIKGRFDLVIFNPPYLPTEPGEREPGWINHALDGGPTGTDTIERFLAGLDLHLTKGGRSLLLISSLTGTGTVRKMAEESGFSVEIVAAERYFFEEILVLLLKRKSG